MGNKAPAWSIAFSMISTLFSRQRCGSLPIKSEYDLLFPDSHVPFVKAINVILGAGAPLISSLLTRFYSTLATWELYEKLRPIPILLGINSHVGTMVSSLRLFLAKVLVFYWGMAA
jgi:hypothetical protein